MTTLDDHQFEILPSEFSTDGFVFGIGAEVSVDDGGFDPGSTDWLVQDSQNSRRGVVGFGRDVLGGMTWAWDAHTDRSTEEEAVDTLDLFSSMWRPEMIALEPGQLTRLRYRLAGRNRCVFGRPRRYSAPPTNLILGGMVPITLDFACVDSFTYDDLESSVEIPYASSLSGGGFILPATLPVSTLPSEGNGTAQISVGGRARVYPVIRLNGPWTDPVFDVGDWKISWTGSIPDGGYVEIDCRPWRLTVLDENGGSAVEGLAKQTWLEDCWFAPQSTPQVTLRGIATTGAATATVSWRNTWTSI